MIVDVDVAPLSLVIFIQKHKWGIGMAAMESSYFELSVAGA